MTLPSIGTMPQAVSGVAIVTLRSADSQAANGLGYMFRPQSEADVGIDGHIEIIDQEKRTPTGRFLGVQIKAGPSYFNSTYENGWIVYVPHATVHYWRQYAVPVILTLVDLETKETYWVRVDKGDFEATEESYKIPVPRANRFDRSAADALSTLASPVAPSLYQLITASADSGQKLTIETSAFYDRVRASASESEWIDCATAGVALANKVRELGQPYQALAVAHAAARAFLQAGKADDAYAVLADWMTFALRELRDGDAARDVYGHGTVPPTISGWPKGVVASAENRLKVDVLRAEAAGFLGDAEAAGEMARKLEELAKLEQDDEQRKLLRLEACRLNALAADVAGDHAAAATSYREVALLANADEGIAKLALVRAVVHGASRTDPIGGASAIANLVGPSEDAVSQMAMGWLYVLGSEWQLARASFLKADALGRAANDIYLAARALRNAEWVDMHVGFWPAQDDRPGQQAILLEPAVDAVVLRRSRVSRLLERADAAYHRADLREAHLKFHQARVTSVQEFDWAAYHEANVGLAAVARAAAVEAPTRDLLLDALRQTAPTRVYVSKDQQEGLKKFEEVLRDNVGGEASDQVWTAIASSVESADEIAGALVTAKTLADRLSFPLRDERVADLICRGIEVESTTARGRPFQAACELLAALSPQLSGASAGRVRDFLVKRIDAAKNLDFGLALHSVAVASWRAPAPEDGGEQLLERLLAWEGVSAVPDFKSDWISALASLARVGNAKVRQRIESIFLEGIKGNEGKLLEWIFVHAALAAGMSVDVQLADRYLAVHSKLLRTLTAQVGTGSFGGGHRHFREVTAWAVKVASKEAREDAVRASAEFIGSAHLLSERLGWIPFAGLLARSDSTFVGILLPPLIATARGEIAPAGGFDDFYHPLAAIRIVGNTPEAGRSLALTWMGSLLAVASEADAAVIVAELNAASGDDSVDVREAVAEGAAWAYANLANESTRLPLRGVLEKLGRDPVDRVAVVALRALTGLAADRG